MLLQPTGRLEVGVGAKGPPREQPGCEAEVGAGARWSALPAGPVLCSPCSWVGGAGRVVTEGLTGCSITQSILANQVWPPLGRQHGATCWDSSSWAFAPTSCGGAYGRSSRVPGPTVAAGPLVHVLSQTAGCPPTSLRCSRLRPPCPQGLSAWARPWPGLTHCPSRGLPRS